MKIKILSMLVMLPAISLLLCSCAGNKTPANNASRVNSKNIPARSEEQIKKMRESDEKRKALEAQYKAMPVPELAKKLAEDSAKDIEPFNSLAFRELTSRPGAINSDFAAYTKSADRSSFLALLVIRKMNKDSYAAISAETKAAILTDALSSAKQFNAWGLPHLYWEDAGKAVIETGLPAVGELKKMLNDKTEAPVWGSEEAMEYKKYGYRRCDYALALILEIQQKKSEIPVKPEERDRLIDGLLKERETE